MATARAPRAERIGFGLLGMRERMDALAGQLYIEAGPGGRGWSVIVRLPLADEAAGRRADGGFVMDILLVEDHPIVRDGLKRLLSAIPAAAVREETTGRGALAAVRARRPDLMILDLNLPDIGGFDVLGRLKREDAR